jgi:hypothetical protein
MCTHQGKTPTRGQYTGRSRRSASRTTSTYSAGILEGATPDFSQLLDIPPALKVLLGISRLGSRPDREKVKLDLLVKQFSARASQVLQAQRLVESRLHAFFAMGGRPTSVYHMHSSIGAVAMHQRPGTGFPAPPSNTYRCNKLRLVRNI